VNAGTEPLLLALDTATPTVSLALFDGSRILVEMTWVAGREHTRRLLLHVDRAPELIGRSVRDLTGLAAATGPGSFTGVRAGLSVAVGLALARNLPAWGVDTLCLLDREANVATLPVRPLIEVGRGRFATAVFLEHTRTEPMRGATVTQVATTITEPTVVIGELSAQDREVLGGNPNVRLVQPAASLRRAGFLAQVAWDMGHAGNLGRIRELDAVYLPPD
jgi:tRNA threonylcarbamoyladenosine biosynthesis protein TsaB